MLTFTCRYDKWSSSTRSITSNLIVNCQVTGRPLTQGDYLRDEIFLARGLAGMQEGEERIREEGLDNMVVEDF